MLTMRSLNRKRNSTTRYLFHAGLLNSVMLDSKPKGNNGVPIGPTARIAECLSEATKIALLEGFLEHREARS